MPEHPARRRTPLARVLLEAERERFSRARPYTARAGGSGNVPSGACPDCEVLAALVPERVLPFASGVPGSAALKPSRGKTSAKCRGGAPKGERARSMRSELCKDPGLAPPASEEKETGRAPHRFPMRPGGAPVGAPPPFFQGRKFLATLLGVAFWLGFFGVSKARVRRRIARTDGCVSQSDMRA